MYVMYCTNKLSRADWLEKLQQAGLRPHLWLEGLIFCLPVISFHVHIMIVQ